MSRLKDIRKYVKSSFQRWGKRDRIIGCCCLMCLMSAALLAGCTSADSTLAGVGMKELNALQGHWVDINGETTLDFDKNNMTVTSPYNKETFKVKISGDDAKYIENAKPEYEYDKGFGIIGVIRIGYDGALTAHEMVMDATGHEYRFVREEDVDKELEIQIEDRDLPKSIESDEIVSFNLVFSNEYSAYDIPPEEPWYGGVYSFDVERDDDGGYEMSLHGSGSSYIIVDYSGPVSEDYVRGLADLVKEQNLAEFNGWHRTNSEQFDRWYVNIEYASGENILMEASGRAALECPFSIYAFLRYADTEAGYTKELLESDLSMK